MRFHSSHSFLTTTRQGQTRPILARPLTFLLLIFLGLFLAGCGGSSESDSAANAIATDAPANTPAPAPTVAPTVAPTEVPAESAPEATASPGESTPTGAAEAATGPILFVIDPEQSEARFIVDEVLFGNPNTVTGRTNGVSGEIAINLDDPAQTTVGPIQVDARSLATDNRFRNRSINRLILQSNRDEYQFITFTPTSIEGLPDAVAPGDSLSFQIVGDLQIRDTVQPVTFDVTVTADSPTQISGLAQTIVQRANFDLEIPEVEGVADVTDDVHLELEFIAKAQE